jgi:hypothetical protein
MSLQRFTIGCMLGFARVVHGALTILWFLEVVRGTMTP